MFSSFVGLECIQESHGGGGPARTGPQNTVTCATTVIVCMYHYSKRKSADSYSQTETQSCGFPGDEKDKDTCKKNDLGRVLGSGKVDRTAFCDTNLCNTKEFYDSKCGGGQAGLKPSFILAFCSVVMYLSGKSFIFTRS